FQFLNDARWPFNPDEFDICGIAQTEVGVRSILTRITAAAGDLAHLPALQARDCRLHANLRSEAGPIGNATGTLDDQPIIAVSVVAVEKIILIIQIRHEQIEESIVVVVSPGAAITNGAVICQAARGDFREGTVAIVMVEKIILSRAAGRAVGD